MIEQKIPTISELQKRVILTENEINGIIRKQAHKIAPYLIKHAIHILYTVTVLNGASYYAAKLIPALGEAVTSLDKKYRLHIVEDNLIASRYGPKTSSSRAVKIIKDLKHNINGKYVLVIEDIADKCVTLRGVISHLKAMKPTNIMVSVLIKREGINRINHNQVWVGYRLEGDEWICGFGLDYAELYRELKMIIAVKKQFCSDYMTDKIKKCLQYE